MKKTTRSAILLVTALLLFAAAGEAQTYRLLCSYAGGSHGQGIAPPTQLAANLTTQISQSLGVYRPDIFRGGVPNAAAVALNGRPTIVYNSEFLNALAQWDPWAPVSVLAHEVGHHVNMDASLYGSFKHPWTKELQADFVSGCALARMGAPLGSAVSAQRAMFNLTGSWSHPDTPRRIAAIEQGWARCGGRGSIGRGLGR